MDTWWTLVRFLHVLSATMRIGGMLFLGLVAVPAARANPDPVARRGLITAVARRFGVFAGVAWAGLLATGFGLLHHRGYDGIAPLFDTTYGRRVFAKLCLLLFVGLIALLHGFVQGPRVRRAEEAGDVEGARRLKAIGGIMDAVMLLGSLAALWLATSLIP